MVRKNTNKLVLVGFTLAILFVFGSIACNAFGCSVCNREVTSTDYDAFQSANNDESVEVGTQHACNGVAAPALNIPYNCFLCVQSISGTINNHGNTLGNGYHMQTSACASKLWKPTLTSKKCECIKRKYFYIYSYMGFFLECPVGHINITGHIRYRRGTKIGDGDVSCDLSNEPGCKKE